MEYVNAKVKYGISNGLPAALLEVDGGRFVIGAFGESFESAKVHVFAMARKIFEGGVPRDEMTQIEVPDGTRR